MKKQSSLPGRTDLSFFLVPLLSEDYADMELKEKGFLYSGQKAVQGVFMIHFVVWI